MSEFIDILSPSALKDLQTANSEIVKLIANIDKAGASMKGMSVPSQGDAQIKKLNEDLQKQSKIISDLQKQLKNLATTRQQNNTRTSEEIVNQRALAQSADRQTRATSALVGAYANLNAKHQQARKTLQDLIASQTASSSAIRKAQSEFNVLDKRITKADLAVRSFNRNVGNYPQITRLTSSLRSLMGAFGLFSGVYLFATVIKDAFKVTKEFDKATADLAATLGKTRSEITDLTASAKQFGATTIYTATQVTSLQKELGKLGFSKNEILASTEGILNLASAVDTDLKKAAEVGGSTLRAFNLDASEMGRVVDVMAKGFTSSALDIENFKESIKYVAPIASASNVSLERTTALLGVLADNGIKGSMAGTSLRRIMTDIVRTGKPFNEGLKEIVKNGISVKDAFDEVGRTAQTSLVILGKNIDKLELLSGALNDAGGSAKKMADEQLNSLEGKIKLLTSAWDGFILSLNDGDGKMSTFFRDALDGLTDFVTGLQEATEDISAKVERRSQQFVDDTLKAIKGTEAERQSQLTSELKRIDTIIDKQRELLEVAKEKEKSEKESFSYRILRNQKEGKLLEEERKSIETNLKISLSAQSKILKNLDEQYLTREQLNEKFVQTFLKVNPLAKESVTLDYAKAKSTERLKVELQQLLNLLEERGKTSSLSKDEEAELKRLLALRAKLAEEELKRLYQLQKMKLESEKRFFDDLSEEEYKHYSDREDAVFDSISKEIELAELSRDESLRIAGDNKTQQLIVWEEYYKDYESIVKNSESKLLKLKQNFFDEFNSYSEKYEGEGLKLDIFGGDPIKAFQDWKDKSEKLGDDMEADWQDTFMNIAGSAQQGLSIISELQSQQTDKRLAELETERDMAILFAGESATAKENIERQYEERKNALLKRQFEQEKRFAIVESIINTASAVVGALPNIPLSILVGALGLAQTTIIAGQSMPAFAVGTDNAPQGWALTQEKGAEIITDKSGKVKTLGTNKGSTKTYLNKGDKVFTAEQSKSIIFDSKLNNILSNNGILPPQIINNAGLSDAKFEKGINELKATIKNKSELHYFSDKQGERVYKKEQGKRALLVSNRLRIK